jgi:hypothetical protein
LAVAESDRVVGHSVKLLAWDPRARVVCWDLGGVRWRAGIGDARVDLRRVRRLRHRGIRAVLKVVAAGGEPEQQ